LHFSYLQYSHLTYSYKLRQIRTSWPKAIFTQFTKILFFKTPLFSSCYRVIL
jgi:hypothetical protein